MKRWLALCLVSCLLLTGMPWNALTVTADDYIYEDEEVFESETPSIEDYLTYEIVDGEVTITDCDTSVEGELVIPDTIEGYPVTKIGDFAFYECFDMTGIVLPAGLTGIDEWAFSDCRSLKSITIPGGVKEIKEWTFFYCESMEKVVMEDGVESIGDSAFSYNYALTEITVPASVTSIHADAFYDCSNFTIYGEAGSTAETFATQNNISFKALEQENVPECLVYTIENGEVTITDCDYAVKGAVVVPAKIEGCPVTKIGASAFYYCRSITEVVLPDTVKTIEMEAFESCVSLTQITIPDSVETIGNYAFGGNSALTTVVIGDGVKTIGDRAFYNCNQLTSVTFGNNVETIGANAFAYAYALPELHLPSSLKTIGNNAFTYNNALTSVTVPDNVTSIGNNAFSYCNVLESITFGAGITLWGQYITTGSNQLTSIIFADGITQIGVHTFYMTGGLQSVTIPATVTSIGKGVFSSCNALTDVYFGGTEQQWNAVTIGEYNDPLATATVHFTEAPVDPVPDCLTYEIVDGEVIITGCDAAAKGELVIPAEIEGYPVTTIGVCAFYNCKLLTSITIPDSVTTIEMQAFERCEGLTAITIPDSVTEMDGWALAYCKALKSVTLSKNLTSISNWMFYSCFDLVSVTGGERVESIGQSAFEFCYDLETYAIPNSVKSIGVDAFFDCRRLTTIDIPDGLQTIESYAFAFCESVTAITIPTDVTNIGAGAFYGCEKMTSVTIPVAVTQIGTNAFRDCVALADVYYGGSKAQWNAISKGTYNTGLDIATIHFATASIPIADVQFTLEYTSGYYQGAPLTPTVTATYDGEALNVAEEFVVTYQNNDKVGTATVTVTGINQFEGAITLTFTISYESIPETIVNVVAIGEIGKISLSWGRSTEVATDAYRIYRKAKGDADYQLLTTVKGRDKVSYEDTAVTKGETYTYYVVGVGLYGALSAPSAKVSATALFDETNPTVLKVENSLGTVMAGKVTLSATATDNVGVAKVTYYYSVDGGDTWVLIGESKNSAFSLVFDTAGLTADSVRVKAVAVDAEGNESAPYVSAYSLDNVGPEKVTGLAATVLSSKITLSWNDVTANDAASFILQTQTDGQWVNVAKNITSLGYNVSGLKASTAYTYRVACVDVRGNVGEYSDAFTVTTAKDETAPVITAQSPAPARYNRQIRFSATAVDDCGIQSITIEISSDKKTWTEVKTNTYTAYASQQTFTYTIDLNNVAEGSVFVRAIATDFTGNVSTNDETAPYVEYIVDKTAPKAPEKVAAVGADGYITVSWAQGDEVDLGKYEVYRAESQNGTYTRIASNLSALNYHDRSVKSGVTYYYKVAVTDQCGLVSDASAVVSASMVTDTKAPEITGISANGQKIGPKTNTVKVSATDNNKLSTVVVEYRTALDGEWMSLAEKTAIDNYYVSVSATLPIETLSHGDKIYLRAYAVDMAGLCSPEATAEYTVDLTPPTVTALTAKSEGATVTLTWNDGRESDLAGFKVYRSVNGGTRSLIGSRGGNNTGAYVFVDTLTAQQSGVYTYTVEAVDSIGNTASHTVTLQYTYEYVNRAPVAQMIVPSDWEIGVEEMLDASDSTDDMGTLSYFWDFGDGTTSTECRPVKKYTSEDSFTVTLTVTDGEGATSTVEKEITVHGRKTLGVLNVKVTDENGKALAHVPVYFDLGSNAQRIVNTNAQGVATLQLAGGTHTVGMYAAGYLPVKKDVVVLANATRTVTLTTVEEELVTGEFEVKRMTFEEIVAAGIDVKDAANSHVYSATVQVTYGSSKEPLTVNYYRDENKVLDFKITDSMGNPVVEFTNGNGEPRKIAGVVLLPTGGGEGVSSSGPSEVVAIIDIPAEASYLKEFFDVRLHIINNASSDFVLEKNEVVLNVPDGMTLMTSVNAPYANSETVIIDEIRGQQTVTLSWVLRGDKAGEYDLSANFTGTLAEFNELVTTRFETDEPIKVYGLEGVKFRFLAADEIHNNTLYFKVELENERPIDLYMPSIGVTDRIENVTESVLHQKDDGDYSVNTYLLNAYLQTGDGEKTYLPVSYDANGRATTPISALAPGQKLVYEYVAYNAVNYSGVAYFKGALITEFKGEIDNIETGSYTRDRYSFIDYSEKLDAILNGNDPDVKAAYTHIVDDAKYYYVGEAENLWNSICEGVYKSIDAVLDFDIDNFTQDEQRAMIQQQILEILADSSVVQAVDDLMVLKQCGAVTGIIEEIGSIAIDYGDAEDVASLVSDLVADTKELAMIYANQGHEALMTALRQRLAGYAIGTTVDIISMLTPISEHFEFSDAFDFGADIISGLYKAQAQAERDAAYFAILKMQCNAEIANCILESLIKATEKDALDYLNDLINKGLLAPTAGIYSIAMFQLNEKELLHVIAKEMQDDLFKELDEYHKTWERIKNSVIQAGGTLINIGVDIVLKKMFGATPVGLILAGYSVVESLFGFENYTQQVDNMQVYNELSSALLWSFNQSTRERSSDADFMSMLYLRALCETRLDGEAQFQSFMDAYIKGEYLYPRDEAEVLGMINRAMGTGYFDYEAWKNTVQRNIVRSRDVLFNIEFTELPEQPDAPSVSLNYHTLTTDQTFSAEYEYCFADGEWKPCDGERIAFEVGSVPGTLRVRKAATDTTLAGRITTVVVYARKELSKLIDVRFDGTTYTFGNLSADRHYQVVFTNDAKAAVDWSNAVLAEGNSVQADGYTFAWIRGCEVPSLNETTTHPLLLTVKTKRALPLTVKGNGTVTQTAEDGRYFIGDTIELTATPAENQRFIGWYLGERCVSTDTTYLAEMTERLALTAVFARKITVGVTVVNADGGVNISWTVSDTVDQSVVYRSEYVDGAWTAWKQIAQTTDLDYTDTDQLVNGRKYRYMVRVLADGVLSVANAGIILQRLENVTVTASNGVSGIQLSWNAHAVASKYYLYRSEYQNGEWTAFERMIFTKGTEYTDMYAQNGTLYRYMVRAVYGTDLSGETEGTTVMRLAVTSLSATNKSGGIAVEWKANAFAESYALYRSENVDGEWTDWGAPICTTSSTAYLDDTAENGVQYRYMVRSVNGEYVSGSKVGATLYRLSSADVTAETVNDGVKISWAKNDVAAKYYVYRCEYVDGAWTSWKRIATTTTNITVYTDETVTNGVRYRYMVRAVKGDDQSFAKAGSSFVYVAKQAG